VHLLDCASGATIQTLQVGQGSVHADALSPDNRLLTVSNDKDGTATIWDLPAEHIQVELPEASFIFSSTSAGAPLSTFSPDGRLLAYSARAYTVNIWDVEAKRVRWSLRGHGWDLGGMSFSPDGKLLATSSADGDARVWNVATGKQDVPTLKGHRRGVSKTWFTRDSGTLVTASEDTTVRFWNLAAAQETVTINGPYRVLLALDESALLLQGRDGVSLVRIPALFQIDALEAAKLRK
jgi:WD40 repeat protein